MEDRIGSIEVGKYADLVVWNEDMYAIPTERLKDLRARGPGPQTTSNPAHPS